MKTNENHAAARLTRLVQGGIISGAIGKRAPAPDLQLEQHRSEEPDPAQSQRPISAVVPAYNEAGRIGAVIRTLCQVDALSEIIVVDDGSRDATSAEALQASEGDVRLRVIRHDANRGKGGALFTGREAASSPYVVMIDADLTSLQPHHVVDLIEPVTAGRADMSLGIFKSGYWRTDLSQWLTPWLTGQRCMKAELWDDIPRHAAAGYGFETALTLAANRHHWATENVTLKGVSHVAGDIPHGSWRGPLNKTKMFYHIGRAWIETEDWATVAPRFGRRMRLILVLFLAFFFSMFNSCSVAAAWVHQLLVVHSIRFTDTYWMILGKLKIALDFLQ